MKNKRSLNKKSKFNLNQILSKTQKSQIKGGANIIIEDNIGM